MVHARAIVTGSTTKINIRGTLRPVRDQDGLVGVHLPMHIGVKRPAGAPARAWLVQAPSTFQFPMEPGSEGGPVFGGVQTRSQSVVIVQMHKAAVAHSTA